MEFYAKSKPDWPHTETIQQHTEALLRGYHILKQHYQHKLIWMTERDWQLLYWAVLYHDVGKYDTVFQNKILKAIKQPLLEVSHLHNIRHNYISVLAIPYKQLGLSSREEIMVLAQAVGYHHEGTVITDSADFNKHAAAAYKNHILPYADQIEQQLGITLDRKVSTSKLANLQPANRFTESSKAWFYKYVLIKGLLHRLDHAASAHVDVELAAEMAVGEYASHFIEQKMTVKRGNVLVPAQKNALQRFTEQNQHQHVVVVAQTGMGKTEAGLLWLGQDKGFFTLPLRVSINSMYNRIIHKDGIAFTKRLDEQIEEATGLLHSTTIDHLQQLLDADEEALEKTHSQSAQYTNKLVISTIDQILKFPLYYLGFEKEYATLAYSKVIIDELQAYDPRIAAVIIRALTMIDRIGGSFMIMTATLPPFYYTALQKQLANNKRDLQAVALENECTRPQLVYGEYIDDTVVRHHVQIRSESIIDEHTIQRMINDGKQRKVLVICNTVKRAVQVYCQLQEHIGDRNLLHSRLIKKERAQRERNVLEFADQDHSVGIWVTTQLVEASLDIDFDILHTEMSSLDSQFQRYGRCNRRGLKSTKEANIFVYTANVSGVNIGQNSIYHDDIYQRSLELFGNFQASILTEKEKHHLIKLLYDEEALNNSTFKQLFDNTLTQLEDRTLYETSRKQAQDLLRDIHEIQVIPEFYRGNSDIEAALNDWNTAKGNYEQVARIRRKARQTIDQYTVGVNEHFARSRNLLSPVHPLKDVYYVALQYDEQTGLDTSKITSETAIFT